MADWSRVVNTTIKKYIREEEVNILRNRKVPAMLMSKGRISYNNSGDDFDWKVRYKRAPLSGYEDGDTITFSRKDRWKTATLGYRGYSLDDAAYKKETLKNRGTEAIIKFYDQITKNLMDDAEDQFGDEFYIDGNASGNSRRFHGVNSFMANTGVGTAVPVATNDDSYAGLDTDLAAYGGSWTGNWPIGAGTSEYDFWTPLLVDYTSAITPSATNVGWSATTKTWANTCLEALRFGIIHTQKNKSAKGMLDLILLNNELYRQFLAHAEAKERIIVEPNTPLRNLGFKDTVTLDGVEITWEFGLPTTEGYGFNFNFMELLSMQDQLWVPEGPDYDIATKSWRFSVDCLGNLKMNPRFFAKWDNYS